MYHTQEKRDKELTGPIICRKDNAWLGVAWYFWYDDQDAFFWGQVSKNKTGYFEIYKADLECVNVLDTVFNEEHYLFWVKQVEKAKKAFLKSGKNLTLKQLNDYFLDKKIWSQLDGIMFQHMAESGDAFIVKDFQYKKRIQLAVYNVDIIGNFALSSTEKCV